jgi:hypothetical protein
MHFFFTQLKSGDAEIGFLQTLENFGPLILAFRELITHYSVVTFRSAHQWAKWHQKLNE